MNTRKRYPVEGKPPEPSRAKPTTRLLATLVLIPTVPMLLLSLAALAVFYAAPTRFGNLIEALPGDAFIRSALVFAPVTLFAVVVLATLYALERPAQSALAPGREERVAPGEPGAAPAAMRVLPLAARAYLIPAVPALLLSTALWALSFVAPTRFDQLMTPLPGDRYLRHLVAPGALLLFSSVLLAVYAARKEGSRTPHVPGLTLLAVGGSLTLAVPSLLLSLAALALSILSPKRFEALMARIPYEQFVRTALIFAPAVLFMVILLASLYLWERGEIKAQPAPQPPPSLRRDDLQTLRSVLGSVVLVGGLLLTAVVGLALLGTLLYSLLR